MKWGLYVTALALVRSSQSVIHRIFARSLVLAPVHAVLWVSNFLCSTGCTDVD
jgi:hypothetical protein